MRSAPWQRGTGSAGTVMHASAREVCSVPGTSTMAPGWVQGAAASSLSCARKGLSQLAQGCSTSSKHTANGRVTCAEQAKCSCFPVALDCKLQRGEPAVWADGIDAHISRLQAFQQGLYNLLVAVFGYRIVLLDACRKGMAHEQFCRKSEYHRLLVYGGHCT